MSQVGIVRENAILPFKAAADLTGQEGRPVVCESATGTVTLTDDPSGLIPIGVLLKGGKQGETVSVAIAAGGAVGTVRLKLAAPAALGDRLKLESLGTFCAFAPDNGTGDRITMAMALESGLAEEKIEAVLFKPELLLA